MAATEKQRICLTICGVDYVLLSERGEAYMHALGQELDEKMNRLIRENAHVSATQAGVLCALQAMDETREAVAAAENLRSRIQDYLEDAAQMKREAELARQEAEQLRREVKELRRGR